MLFETCRLLTLLDNVNTAAEQVFKRSLFLLSDLLDPRFNYWVLWFLMFEHIGLKISFSFLKDLFLFLLNILWWSLPKNLLNGKQDKKVLSQIGI